MSTTRLRVSSALLAAGLFVFLFGSSNAFAATKTWTGGNSTWETAGNWSPSGVPGAGDDVVIPGGLGAQISYTGAKSVLSMSITGTVVLVSNDLITVTGSLVVGSASGSAVGTLLLQYVNSSGGLMLDVNGSLVMQYAGSTIQNSQVVNRDITIQLDGTMFMVDVTCYVGNVGGGASIFTTMNSSSALLSAVRFESDLNLPTGLLLGNNDLYLGLYADLFTPNASEGITGNFVETSGTNSTPAGTLRKQFSAVGDEFYFPLGPAGGRMSPITFKVVSPTQPSAFSGGTPWPHISVRCVLNSGGQGGHPENQQQQKVWVHWPVQGYGLACPGIHWAGLMKFHNAYRSGSANDLFSARYTDNYEDVGAGGGWVLTGSVQVFNTTGDIRSVPFGPWLSPYTTPGMPCWGDFTVGQGTQGSDPIPVELTSFAARFVRNNVQLNWQTATELNNYGFAIERSFDGRLWDEIDFVEGTGNSFSPKSYTYTHILDDELRRIPHFSNSLRQIARDRATDYSDIVFVKTGVAPVSVELYSAYPNPFNPSTTISFSVRESMPVTMKIFNLYGQEVVTLLENAETESGFHTVGFNGDNLPSGSYMVVLSAGGTRQQQRLVLNK